MHPSDRWMSEHIATLLLCILTKVATAKDSPLYDAFTTDAQDMGESCLLYPVHSKNPSPSYRLHEGAPIAMTINHLQDSIVATLLLQTTSETCLLLVTKKDITVEGDCLYDQEGFSSLSLVEDQEFLTVLVEQLPGSVQVYLPAAPTRTIRLSLQDLTGGVHAQVSGVGPLNAAFDCFSGCLEIGNSTWVHSNGTLRLFTDPNISGQLKGTMSVLYGIDDREWKRQKQLEFSFDEYLTDFGDSKALVIQPAFGDRIWGGYYLSINKTLTKHRSGNIGAVPTKDLYVQFNNMNNFRWSLGCLLLNNVLMEEEDLAARSVSSNFNNNLEEEELSTINNSSQSTENLEASSNENQSIEGKSSETSIFFGHEAEDDENDSSEKEEESEEINHGEWRKLKSLENNSEEAKYIKDNLLKSIENSMFDDQLNYSIPKSKIKKKSKVVYDDQSNEITDNRIDDSKPYNRENDTEENTNTTNSNTTMSLKPILIDGGIIHLMDNSTNIVILNTTDDHEPENISTLSTGFLFKIVFSTGIVLLLGSLILICIVHGCKKKDGPSNKYHVSQSSMKSSCDIIHNATPDPTTYSVDNPAYSPDN